MIASTEDIIRNIWLVWILMFGSRTTHDNSRCVQFLAHKMLIKHKTIRAQPDGQEAVVMTDGSRHICLPYLTRELKTFNYFHVIVEYLCIQPAAGGGGLQLHFVIK